jgi:RNA polymerase sigma-70 factor, ECF subfamily
VTEARRIAYERLVAEWAGRVHALAYRMLGGRADADDATQEVFLRLWERVESYDASRPFQPWIYRVATRTILNRIRGERRRANKESDAVPPHAPETTEDAVERREREAVVHAGLQRIDADERALLGMHFYGGLTQAEVAEVLDVPRTTVQSRLSNALASLRESLRGAAHLAVLPLLDDVMRGSPSPPVPDALLSSLLGIASPAAGAGAAVTASTVLGGILVTKKLLVAATLLAALCVAGGYAAGRTARERSAADDSESASSRIDAARLVAENRRLEAELARRGGAPSLAAAGSAATKPTGTKLADATGMAATDNASTDASASAPSSAPGAADAAPIDWSKLAAIFAADADRIVALMNEGGDRGDRMKPADKQMVMGLLSEYMRAATSAHALSPRPFFDERVLPGLVVAVFGETLGLSKEKRSALSESLRTLVTERSKTLDFEHMGPVDTFLARQRIVADVLVAVGTVAGPDGRERFERLRPLGENMLEGDHSEVRLGWDGKASAATVGERVLARWKEAYGLDEKQADSVRPIADRYAQDALDVLRRRGIDKADAKGMQPLNPESHTARLEMMGFQVTAEHAIEGLLSDKQREASRGSPPTLIVVHPGEDDMYSTSTWGGI